MHLVPSAFPPTSNCWWTKISREWLQNVKISKTPTLFVNLRQEVINHKLWHKSWLKLDIWFRPRVKRRFFQRNVRQSESFFAWMEWKYHECFWNVINNENIALYMQVKSGQSEEEMIFLLNEGGHFNKLKWNGDSFCLGSLRAICNWLSWLLVRTCSTRVEMSWEAKHDSSRLKLVY